MSGSVRAGGCDSPRLLDWITSNGGDSITHLRTTSAATWLEAALHPLCAAVQRCWNVLHAGKNGGSRLNFTVSKARRVGERDEDLLLAHPGRSHLDPDLGRAARTPVLVPQALEDPLGRVSLLGRGVTVRSQDLVEAG
jgi:hypothetical protein